MIFPCIRNLEKSSEFNLPMYISNSDNKSYLKKEILLKRTGVSHKYVERTPRTAVFVRGCLVTISTETFCHICRRLTLVFVWRTMNSMLVNQFLIFKSFGISSRDFKIVRSIIGFEVNYMDLMNRIRLHGVTRLLRIYVKRFDRSFIDGPEYRSGQTRTNSRSTFV